MKRFFVVFFVILLYLFLYHGVSAKETDGLGLVKSDLGTIQLIGFPVDPTDNKAPSAVEQANRWLAEHPNLFIVNITEHITMIDGKIHNRVVIIYRETRLLAESVVKETSDEREIKSPRRPRSK